MGVLGDTTPAEFLREYWQQKPLLILEALPGSPPPLTADELAGLALAKEVASRLVESAGGSGLCVTARLRKVTS